MDDEAFYAWLTTKEITPEDYQAMDDAGKTALQEEYLAMQASSKSVVQAAIKTAELSKENQTEIVRIRALEAGFKHSPEFLAEALDKKWSFNTARKILTARLKSTNQQKALNAQVKTGKPMKEEMKGDVFLAGFGREFGLTDKNIVDKLFYGQKHRAEPALEAAARQFRQGCGYAELFLSSINSHDRKLDSYHMEQSHEQSRQNRLKSKNPALTASLGFSTIDAQAIIDHVHQTYVEQQYELAEFTAENIGTIREVSDFTKIEMFKPTLLGRIKQIADSGEIPHMSFTIEARTAQSKPLGGILAVPETYYINDDIGLFKDTMNMLAQEAAIAYENDFFEYLRLMMNNTIMAADGQSFFSTARNNYLTGAQSSFSTLGLSNARLQFSKMKNKNDAPILVNPTNLIVPPALEPKAQLIFQSNRTNEGGNEGEAQIYGGKYNPITSPFLGTGMTGNPGMISDTAWLLTAAQNALALIYILKVRGFGSPRLESSTMDISVWGTKYRVLFPYGFAVGDPNAAVLSTGV
ncbi:MAG: Mu-like prophage major head subunit gpT family protein [Planctomycetaceae bacterium]|nr:Mu-like prophage major head subunit gpT family protein [Planctomycetaceae bacterium]